MAINSDRSQYFLIRSSLNSSERIEMFEFLLKRIEVFAWCPSEIMSLDLSVASHSLNVDPTRKSVIQKVQHSSPLHVEAVVKEVEQLLTAGAIREVLYPTWLANTVVVPRKNGKLRVCVDYMNLNDACPMDRFPLLRIEQMVDATTGYERLSFLDAYRSYHQIAMHLDDQEKTAFITPRGVYCYKVVPFGLKNAGATYQRTIMMLFGKQIGKTMEAYIDDMVVKSRFSQDHPDDLGRTFDVLLKYKLRLNAEKCAFGVSSGKLLGFIVSRHGIEADPKQLAVVQNLRAPTTIKELQRLTGMLTALHHFIRRSGDICRPFFQAMKTSRRGFIWTEDCEQSLRNLKAYLSRAPLLVTLVSDEDLYLYLAVSDHATNPPNRGSYRVPLKTVLRKIDSSSRILKFSQDLANYDITFEPRTSVKGQALANFFAELTPGLQDEANLLLQAEENQRLADTEVSNDTAEPRFDTTRTRFTIGNKRPKLEWKIFFGDAWRLNVDGAANVHGAGAGIVLILPVDTLVVGHLNDDYQAKDGRMNAYVSCVLALFRRFGHVKVEWIPQEHNAHVDALAGLASVYKSSSSRTIIFDAVDSPRVEPAGNLMILAVLLGPSRMDPIIAYLKAQTLPPNKKEAHKVRCQAANYYLGTHDVLYRRTFTGPDLGVVHEDQVPSVLEELHAGSCGAHSGG
ncbi:uncharacterized protein LOC131298686 [Rhododendron vialii]|uniref:uncharacterized protein LOC131298686 n=1 Tax=Rhododendron vialii TaxID=182163 RepID=UPI00266000B2|nr:uncharacterized protein LOC131298686 [Rhododendron vialii]